MRAEITVIFLIVLLSACSGDNTEKQTPKKTMATQTKPMATPTKPVEPYPNSPTTQDLLPDLHVSGGQNAHISGGSLTSEHFSGQ